MEVVEKAEVKETSSDLVNNVLQLSLLLNQANSKVDNVGSTVMSLQNAVNQALTALVKRIEAIEKYLQPAGSSSIPAQQLPAQQLSNGVVNERDNLGL